MTFHIGHAMLNKNRAKPSPSRSSRGIIRDVNVIQLCNEPVFEATVISAGNVEMTDIVILWTSRFSAALVPPL